MRALRDDGGWDGKRREAGGLLPLVAIPESARKRPAPESTDGSAARRRAGYWMAIDRISRLLAPRGVATSTESPTRLPIRARAIGEDVEIMPFDRSAS